MKRFRGILAGRHRTGDFKLRPINLMSNTGNDEEYILYLLAALQPYICPLVRPGRGGWASKKSREAKEPVCQNSREAKETALVLTPSGPGYFRHFPWA